MLQRHYFYFILFSSKNVKNFPYGFLWAYRLTIFLTRFHLLLPLLPLSLSLSL
eukprot:c19141_g3_i1 orf=1-156(-)